MPFTFKDLKDQIKTEIWPNGVPENLTSQVDRYFIQAANWMQQNVECLKDEHVDFTPQCATFFHCGLTFLDKPDGIISRVWTVQHKGYCDPVTYFERNKEDVRCWSRGFMQFVTAPANTGLQALPAGFKYPETSTDAVEGRALVGLWAKDGNRLLMAPWLQSYEAVGIEWSGYKRKWADTDLALADADYLRAIKLFVQREYVKDFERDLAMQQIYHDDLHGNPSRNIVGALPALIFQCREKQRIRHAEPCPPETDYLTLTYQKPATVVPVLDKTILAVIGDYGQAGGPENDVATLVKGWSPHHILTTGDNNYPSGAAGTIDANVGQYYHDFILPYRGSYGVNPSVNRFWPVLGNHDLDASTGKPYFDYFTLPPDNGERYYEKIFGHIHVFFINSGYNTAGTQTEVDGITTNSKQAEWTIMRAVRSTIRWKIAIFHHPPYTSRPTDGTFGRYPGVTAMRWNFKDYGFHAAFSGHSHSYERIEVDGFPYFVNGAGGAALVAFSDSVTVDGSKKKYSSDYGAQKITATCDKLLVEFYNRGGTLIDSKEIT